MLIICYLSQLEWKLQLARIFLFIIIILALDLVVIVKYF